MALKVARSVPATLCDGDAGDLQVTSDYRLRGPFSELGALETDGSTIGDLERQFAFREPRVIANRGSRDDRPVEVRSHRERWLEPSAGFASRRKLSLTSVGAVPTAPTNAIRFPSGENDGSTAPVTRDASFRGRPPDIGISHRSANTRWWFR